MFLGKTIPWLCLCLWQTVLFNVIGRKKTFSCFKNTCVHTVHKAIFHATWCTINFLNSSCRLSQSPLQLYVFLVRAWSPLPHLSFEHCGHFYCSELSLWASLHKLPKNTCKYVDLLFLLIGTVKASYPTTLSKDIEELRHGSRRYPQAFNQGLNETSKCLILCYKL